MKILINYANKPYRQTQKWNSWTGRHIGGFDKVYSFSPEDIQREYFENHREILSNPRGNGLWLWKPYFILRVLEQCQEGDLVFYADSGSFFLRGIDHLINGMAEGEDIWVSDIPLLEGSFTAPVCMEKLNCDTERIRNSNQIQGGFLLLRCSRESREFVRRWLALCEDRELINPAVPEETKGECIEHREDQSLLSLLCKEQGIRPHRDPSQFGKYPQDYYNPGYPFRIPSHPEDRYPPVLFLHRSKKLSLWVILRQMCYTLRGIYHYRKTGGKK